MSEKLLSETTAGKEYWRRVVALLPHVATAATIMVRNKLDYWPQASDEAKSNIAWNFDDDIADAAISIARSLVEVELYAEDGMPDAETLADLGKLWGIAD